jgi:hypothetical protein
VSHNPIVDKAVAELERTAFETAEAPDRFRAEVNRLEAAGMLARPSERIPAGHPVTVRRTGLGIELDFHSLIAAMLVDLAQDASDDDVELAEIRDADGGARDRLVEQLVDRLGGATLRIGATDAHRLADAIKTAAGPRRRPVSSMREVAA